MIINSIEMSYFFRIYQSEKIVFSTEEKKNVTVIKGDNGTGKTTILSAFSWVFYGDVEEPLVIDEMLNKRRRFEMSIGEIETAGVKVAISEHGHDYLISRTQKFKKISDSETVRIGEPDYLVIDKMDPSNPINDKNFFDSMIPKDLKGFFFFDGERIDRLAKIDGRVEIKKAILDILGLTTLENIDEAIREVQSEYNKKVKKASKSEVIQQLTEDYEQVLEALDADREKLKAVLEKKKKAEKGIESCKRFLKEHNAETVKNLQLQRDNLETEKAGIQNNQTRENQDVLHFISKKFKYYLMSDRLDEISEFLEEKRKKKELPSDIKVQFVNDLLESGECICGQKLIKGQGCYHNIEKLLETAGREELDNAYITMRAFVDSYDMREVISGFYARINAYSNRLLNNGIRIEEIDKAIKEIGKKLSNDFGDLIARHEELLETATSIKEECVGEEYYLTQTIKSNEAKKNAIEGRLRLEKGKQESKNMFSDAFDMAVELAGLNEKIRRLFVEITREDMDEKIKMVFHELSRKEDREACLGEDFVLSIRNKVTKRNQILSTGERQITSLSFIGALVAYAKEKVDSELITDFSGGDFPIVMDSPFGNLDPTHKANVAKGLPKLATQIIMIISDEQWNGTVEKNIAERVYSVYNMKDGNYEGQDDEYTEFWR